MSEGAEAALKKKYELLKQKQLERQNPKPEAAGQDSSISSPAAPRLAPSGATNVYVDNAANRRLGRVGLPMGSAVHHR